MRMCSASQRPATRANRAATSSGFTLLETGLAIIVIGTGVLAMLEAQQHFLQKNAWSTHSSTAMFLANEIREMTRVFPRHDKFSGGLYFENEISHTNFQGWGPEPGEAAAIDFDDLDDLDGVAFGSGTNLAGPVSLRLPGPINAFREVISNTDWAGVVTTDEDGLDEPLAGWTQYIQVQKVDPVDLRSGVIDQFFQPAAGGNPEIEVDNFPVRITVFVYYQDPSEPTPREISRVSWLALP